MHQLRCELQRKLTSIGQLVSDNQLLKASVQSLSIKLKEAENYQRRDNLIFSGLEVRIADRLGCTNDLLAISSDSLTKTVFEFCNTVLDCHVQVSNISAAHTLPSRNANSPSSITVRFTRRSIKDNVYLARLQAEEFYYACYQQ